MSSPLAPEQALRLQAAERRWLEGARHRLRRRPAPTRPTIPVPSREAPAATPASPSEESVR